MRCFHAEQGNLIRSAVFSNANSSNLRGSLLEGNKDHLLNQARSDLAKQELHVKSLNKYIGELHRQTEEQSTIVFCVVNFDSKNQVTTCSDFPSDAMLWIKELEMVDSSDEMIFPRSIQGYAFDMLDAKITSALNKIIQNSKLKNQVSLEEQKAQKEDRFFRGRQIAFMIYDYFRVTGAQDTALDYADLFSVTLHDDNTGWDEVLSMSKIPSDDNLGKCVQIKDT